MRGLPGSIQPLDDSGDFGYARRDRHCEFLAESPLDLLPLVVAATARGHLQAREVRRRRVRIPAVREHVLLLGGEGVPTVDALVAREPAFHASFRRCGQSSRAALWLLLYTADSK